MVLKTSYTFWIWKSRKDKNGFSPLSMRIYVGDEKTELSTGIKVNPINWDSKAQKVLPKQPEYKTLNAKIESLKTDYNEVLRDLLQARIPFNPESLKRRMSGENEQINRTVMEVTK